MNFNTPGFLGSTVLAILVCFFVFLQTIMYRKRLNKFYEFETSVMLGESFSATFIAYLNSINEYAQYSMKTTLLFVFKKKFLSKYLNLTQDCYERTTAELSRIDCYTEENNGRIENSKFLSFLYHWEKIEEVIYIQNKDKNNKWEIKAKYCVLLGISKNSLVFLDSVTVKAWDMIFQHMDLLLHRNSIDLMNRFIAEIEKSAKKSPVFAWSPFDSWYLHIPKYLQKNNSKIAHMFSRELTRIKQDLEKNEENYAMRTVELKIEKLQKSILLGYTDDAVLEKERKKIIKERDILLRKIIAIESDISQYKLYVEKLSDPAEIKRLLEATIIKK